MAVLNAGDLRNEGIVVEPQPVEEATGHAGLPQLNSKNRKETTTLEYQRKLVELCLRVEGPFETP